MKDELTRRAEEAEARTAKAERGRRSDAGLLRAALAHLRDLRGRAPGCELCGVEDELGEVGFGPGCESVLVCAACDVRRWGGGGAAP